MSARRTWIRGKAKTPLTTVIASFLLALVALALAGCGRAPVDDLLADGAECGRDAQCQSGYCWQADGAEAKTCQATASPALADDE